jgi:hypothetical protein
MVKIAVFWNIASCSLYMNRSLGETYHLHLRSPETSVHIRTTRRCIPEYDNFYNYRYENLSCYISLWYFSRDSWIAPKGKYDSYGGGGVALRLFEESTDN